MIKELETTASLIIIIFCAFMFFTNDPYFDDWKQCLVMNGNPIIDTYTDHPFVDGKCCHYELLEGNIQCVT